MTKFEQLLAEFENDLVIEELPISVDGLYSDGVVWLREDMTAAQKHSVLAEEIGHHLTSSGDILNLSDINNQKQELKARRWAYEKILPPENIHFAIADGHTEMWDMAEYLEVDEAFLREALKYYGFLDAV